VPLRAKVNEIEIDVAALYAESEELHRKVDAP
jgi:outer membrane murein-binding lipoprotein Lpp